MSESSVHGSSIDPREVAYYDRLAEQWWDRQGSFWPLHLLNELRVGYIREHMCAHFDRDPRLPRPFEGLRVLDIGCGGGILSEAIARLGARVHGIDVAARNIEIVRRHAAAAGLGIGYDVVTVEELSASKARYDVVLNMEVVEHMADLPGFLGACANTVDPGGLMFVATINRTLLSWLFAIVGAEYILGWLPRGTHRWRRFRRPAELETMLSRHGLRAVERRGVRINALTRGFSLSDFLGVNYMLVFTGAPLASKN
jgi:2-polyprenyl-6-hydroxyphenyl methylase/3-demethylubiquinone-9 3-methyltransferase